MTKHDPNHYIMAGVLSICLLVFGSIVSFTQASPQVRQTETNKTYSKTELLEEKANVMTFLSPVYLDRDKTLVSFPFAFSGEPHTLWLGFNPTSEEERREILVSHPQLLNLTWDVVSENGVNLYQRNKQFASVAEFFGNMPPKEKIAVDSFLKKDFPQLGGITELNKGFEIENTHYILTTFAHPEYINGVYYFETVVDATEAYIDDINQIQWYIRSFEASGDNPYLYGHINVNYVQ